MRTSKTYPAISAFGIALIDTTSAAAGLVNAGVHGDSSRGMRVRW